jgi:hypothetical protein
MCKTDNYSRIVGGNMKKTIILALVSILLLATFVGCSDSKKQNQNCNSSGMIHGENNLDESQAYFFEYGKIAKASENGYYYILDNFIHYYDIDIKAGTVLCNKAECNHKNKECMAYLNRELYKDQNLLL